MICPSTEPVLQGSTRAVSTASRLIGILHSYLICFEGCTGPKPSTALTRSTSIRQAQKVGERFERCLGRMMFHALRVGLCSLGGDADSEQ